jgi:hypothetical protein
LVVGDYWTSIFVIVILSLTDRPECLGAVAHFEIVRSNPYSG